MARGVVAVLMVAGTAAGAAGCVQDDAPPDRTGPAAPAAVTRTTDAGRAAGRNTLGDNGIGGLSIGMTEQQARATGLLGDREPGDDACLRHRGRRGVEHVYLENGRVAIIAVDATVATASGIHAGSTVTDVHRAYPGVSIPADDLGRIYLPAPGAARAAQYRLGLDESNAYPTARVTEIALQTDDQGCYE